MRALVHAETAAAELMALKVRQGLLSQKEAQELHGWAFRHALATIGNWRRRNAAPDLITDAIQRRKKAATTRYDLARTWEQRTKLYRDVVLAQMFEVVWMGMQKDNASYAGRR